MMVKIYVGDAKVATVICHKCGLNKNIDVTKFKDTKKTLKAKCGCGAVFKLILEFRKNCRKKVRLPGEYFLQKKPERGDILVDNISGSGIRFATLNPNTLLKDDTVELTFTLDNQMKTEVRGLVKIIWVDGRNIGAEYVNSRSFTSKLGFYLQTKENM